VARFFFACRLERYNAVMKRIRMSLRLMLLLVALFAVVFAWVGARRELHRANVRGELNDLQLYREYVYAHPGIYTNEQAWRSSLNEMDTAIEERQEMLGEAER
jgi:hypothetical protein